MTQAYTKFRLDTIKSPVSDVFTGPLLLTPLKLQERVWYYGIDYVNQGERIVSNSKKWCAKCCLLWRRAAVMVKELTEFKYAGWLNPNTTHPQQLKQMSAAFILVSECIDISEFRLNAWGRRLSKIQIMWPLQSCETERKYFCLRWHDLEESKTEARKKERYDSLTSVRSHWSII